ncbi:hypothetical protein QQ045_018402 [Rhodiola kirilowii]
MAAPIRAAVSTDSLERSLRSFSIHDSGDRCRGSRTREMHKSETVRQQELITIDLNSETPLPYNWEQCLDLKTGEIYFINRSNGLKTKEDPREMPEYSGEYYCSDDEEDDDESLDYETDEDRCGSTLVNGGGGGQGGVENVLVAAGCRSCLMYYMVSKQVNDCPKCNRQLLHFDTSENSSPVAV